MWTHITILAKPFAWFCILALLVASWTPGQEMVRTGFNARLEHVAAYLIATVAVSLAYPQLHPLRRLVVVMIAYAAVLEVGQLMVPGRHAGLLDWIASSTGVMCGCGGVAFARYRIM